MEYCLASSVLYQPYIPLWNHSSSLVVHGHEVWVPNATLSSPKPLPSAIISSENGYLLGLASTIKKFYLYSYNSTSSASDLSKLVPLANLDWRIKLLVLIGLALSSTYLITSLRSILAVSSTRQHARRVPVAPHWIPFLGHIMSYILSGYGLIENLTVNHYKTTPFGMRFGPIKMYIVTDPKHVQSLFRKTLLGLRADLGLNVAIGPVLGIPKEDQAIYHEDTSGQRLKPWPGSNVPAHRRIRHLHVKASHDFLAGINGLKLGKVYLRVLERNLSADRSIGGKWTDRTDLFKFVSKAVFLAGTESVFGMAILELNPTLHEDYSAFTQHIHTYMKGCPRWAARKAYQARDKMVDTMRRWNQYCEEHGDNTKTGLNDPDWEPVFGGKFPKQRAKMFRESGGMSEAAMASENLGLLFASASNTLPVVFWAVFEVMSRPELAARIRTLVEEAQDPETGELNVAKLCKVPLIQSIFAEVTRQRVVGIIPRTTDRDFEHEGWLYPKGSMIGVPSRPGAMDGNVWNTGTPENPRPLDKFWEERFLVYSDDPSSGPARQNPVSSRATATNKLDVKAKGEARFTLKGVEGAYIPFGGGVSQCPGRHFALTEVINTLGVLLLNFDIDLKIPEGWEPKMDMHFAGLGSLPPQDQTPFRIRRRENIEKDRP
ncbi:cytochrome P450 [Lentithecium fluviatile CBS 122367]|uniref:Cytochrome P450 n=1 Tax=Lentithecium fluviatile CBS 122367 TaxID=1168545 RepID=A0A6G1IF19_9PLEO|nr:cytochrome P450 [Lentithecium fluviatile CBS 122367]